MNNVCIENIEYSPDRNLYKAQTAWLSACTYIQEAHNILILDTTGSGKTYLACAFGMAASRNSHPVRHVRLLDLLAELAIARGDGSFRKVIRQYKQIKL